MKINLLIWLYWPGLQGGSERQARLVAQELVRCGHQCEVYTAWTSVALPRCDDDGGILIHRLGFLVPAFEAVGRFMRKSVRFFQVASGDDRGQKSGFWNSLAFWITVPWTWLARLAFMSEFLWLSCSGRIKCDIIHLHEPLWLGGVAQLASRWIGCSVLCQEATSPAMPTIGYDTPFRGSLAGLRMKPHYIAMAEYTMAQMVERGIPPERIHLLPSGVNVPPAATAGIATLNCLYVANFSQGAVWKAFDILFSAWVQVALKIPAAKLYAVGGGDSSEWKKFVADNRVAGSVFFTGTVEDIQPYFAQSSVFLLPSRVEGMSNALLEAQMWGLACVVSDIPGNLSVVKDKANGIVVPVNNAEELAKAVVHLLGDAGERMRLGRVAREEAVAKFGIKSVVERLVNIYKDVVAERIPGAASAMVVKGD